METTPASVCNTVLVEVVEALTACGRPPLNAAYVAAGLVAWDDCCGMLVVAPERIYRTARWPVEGPDENDCYEGLVAVDVVVLLVRCVPVVDDRGNPPNPAELAAAYDVLLADAAVIWNTLALNLPDEWQWTNETQAYVGAEGGCIGVETRISLGIDQEGWCPPCTTP